MTRIDQLLEELAPDGVDYQPIRQLVEPVSNIRWQNAGSEEYKYVDLSSVDRLTRSIEETEIISAESAPSRAQQIIREDDVLFATTRPMLKRVASVPAAYDGQIASTGYCVLRANQERLDPRFLFHLLGTATFYDFVEAHQRGVSYPAIADRYVKEFRVPVPPIEVQQEIVRELDQFTQLEAELEAELEARRRQYEFYSERLLIQGKDVPRVRLGKIANIVRGASPRPIRQFITEDEDGVPWIKIGDVPVGGKYIECTAQRITPSGALKSRRVAPGDFILSNSMSFGRPYISQIAGCIHDGWLAISGFEESFIPDYLYYLLRSSAVQQEFERRAGAGTVQNLNAEIVRGIELPLPTFAEQQQVVRLLDQFDALVNDLTVGLPAELVARRKQYEHYRDRLLTFEEKR